MKKIKNFVKSIFSSNRVKMLAMLLICGTVATFAQSAAGDYTAGTSALSTVTEEIAKYVPYVVKLCYAIAGVSLDSLRDAAKKSGGKSSSPAPNLAMRMKSLPKYAAMRWRVS